MEVHHHSHTPRKKWAHYFWEFLMLFLAVFCGFLAEYQLEHTLEYQRGKQYAQTMLEDLKADKVALENGINTNNIIVNSIDTLLHIYHPDYREAKTTGQLYYYGGYALVFWYWINKQVTLQQMKHSGTIRYFQNSFLERQMVKLDKSISFIEYWDDKDRLYNEPAIDYSSKLFNYAVLNTVPNISDLIEENDSNAELNTRFVVSRDQLVGSNPPLINHKPELLAEFLNLCNQRLFVLKTKISVYRDALLEIKLLTSELQKTYHLK